MGNLVKNATGMDGATDWSSDGAVTADEATYGAPGRIVLIGQRAAASAYVLSNFAGPQVSAGTVIEAFAHFGSTSGTARLYLDIYSAGGSLLQSVEIPRRLVGRGLPRRGVPSSFHFGYARLASPATGIPRLRVAVTGATSPARAMIMKPFVDSAVKTRKRQPWVAGPHTNVDLNLPAWPSALPILRADQYSVDPIPLAKSFAADSGLPVTARGGTLPRRTLKASLELDVEERDWLEQFFVETPGAFWFMRPDTHELCRAYWAADGEPTDSGLTRGGRRTTFGLSIEVA